MGMFDPDDNPEPTPEQRTQGQDEFNRYLNDLGAMVDRARAESPAYDKEWRDFLQKMADEWDQKALEAVYGKRRIP